MAKPLNIELTDSTESLWNQPFTLYNYMCLTLLPLQDPLTNVSGMDNASLGFHGFCVLSFWKALPSTPSNK